MNILCATLTFRTECIISFHKLKVSNSYRFILVFRKSRFGHVLQDVSVTNT